MKYKVKGITILHNGKIYREGSEIELTEDEAEALKNFLKPLEEKKEDKKRGGNK